WLYENIQQPLILDADALYALAMRKEGLAGAAGPRILTPHLGEFASLKAQSWSGVPADRQGVPGTPQERQADEELAGRFAAEHGLVMVLKGHQTLVTDGTQFYHNETGNPGMATGGSGDVLTGLLAALVCQGLDIMSAACLGVHTHGRSGDLAADQQGQVGMTARDLVDYLPQAIAEQVGG
ncbi:MAG: NAD(P)H-hydrate dehydratase, partial [Planctomycetaceae bacterium]|nr:NAD(P)H-hydrate dehydratase [Planctomycetaceae bacterium]